MKIYQATAIFSVLFALVGFSYNVWRLEVTEHNSNGRSASFEMLLQRAEQLRASWGQHWEQLPTERGAADAIEQAIDATRLAVQQVLLTLD